MSKSKRLYVGVMNQLTELIDNGEFPVGGRLPPERELADRFEVSRPTVREAIIALEALGRVEVKTGSGIYVLKNRLSLSNGLEDISPFELTESRSLIEGEAAALAASLITEEQLKDLNRTLDDMADESDNGDLASGDADREFHQIIANATQNAVLVSLIEQLWYVRNNAPQVFQAYRSICEQDAHRRVEEHRQIYDALIRRDPVAARIAMHNHFERILNKLIQVAEEEKVQAARRQSEEVRSRFSRLHQAAG